MKPLASQMEWSADQVSLALGEEQSFAAELAVLVVHNMVAVVTSWENWTVNQSILT